MRECRHGEHHFGVGMVPFNDRLERMKELLVFVGGAVGLLERENVDTPELAAGMHHIGDHVATVLVYCCTDRGCCAFRNRLRECGFDENHVSLLSVVCAEHTARSGYSISVRGGLSIFDITQISSYNTPTSRT